MKSWTYHNHNIMWPVILVAIAISYVICVLLLSGLQKEDLDANMLGKLERHNVNIYDMNNDSLREECLSDAARKPIDDLNIQQKYTPLNHLNEQIKGNSIATDNRQIQITSQFIDTAGLPHLLDDMLIKDRIQNNNDNSKMITQTENNYKATNVEHNTDKDKKSSLEIVLNFWNKMPHQTTETVLKENKTIDLTRRQHSFITPTAKHSKENDYVSRIIAEYLATQPASTMPSEIKNLSIDFIPESLKHFLEQHEKTTRAGQLQPFDVVNSNENSLNNKEINYLDSFGTSILSSNINKRDYTTQEPLRIYSTPQVNFYNNIKIERDKYIPELGHIDTDNREIVQNKEALKYLNDVLQFSNQNRIDDKNSNTKQKISRYTKTENNIYKDSTRHEGNRISSSNFGINSAGVINTQIGNLKDIRNITDVDTLKKDNGQENKALHYWDDILRFGKQFNVDTQIPMSEKSSLNKNSKSAKQQIYKHYLLQYISNFQNNELKNSKKNQGSQTPSDHGGTVSAEVNNAPEENKYINTVYNENIPKQAALQYLENILLSNKKFDVEAQILNSERGNHDRIDYENNQQMSSNNMLAYISETQNNNGKDRFKSQSNRLLNNYVGSISTEYINEKPLKNDSNTANKNYIQKQAVQQYLDDIIRFSKQFNTQIPYSEKSSQIRMKNEDKKQQILGNNMLPFIPEVLNNNIKNSVKIQSNTTPIDHDGVVSANVINEIAEKVREIVLTDLRRELPKTYYLTSPRNTVITTTAPDIASIPDKLTAHQKDTEEKSELSKTLLEILKEYKTLKERYDSITTSTSNAKLQDKENSIHNENYNLHTNIEQRQLNPYIPNLQAVPRNFPLKINQDMIQSNNYKSYYRLPLTIQTNSDQIAPLAIQISNPNQNIISPIVTAEQPVIKQELGQAFADSLHASKGKNNRINDAIYVDLTKNPNAEKNVLRESYKDSKKSSEIQARIQKLQDRLKYISDHKRKTENTHRSSSTEYRQNIIHLGIPNYHSLGQFSKSNHETDSKHRDTFNWRLNLLHHKYPNRPSESKHHERHKTTNYEDNLSQSRNWQHRDNFHQQGDKIHETRNRSFDFKYLHEPLNSQRQLLNEHLDPRPKDVVTHEILSKLMDSHHHDLLNRFIKSHSTERINRLTDHYRSSDLLKEYIRDEHHPKVSKYHEKLEQSENLSSNNNNPYIDKWSKQTNCDGIASRQQVPLSIKNHQRTRFDDTHFKNFLMSQQKVTDMLEKILAAKTKPELQSVESV